MDVYLGKASKLPTSEAGYRRVLEMKQTTSMSELCAGLPTEFVNYMDYVCTLCDDDISDYGYLRKIFNNLFRQPRFEFDNVFDWTVREFERLEAKS